MVETNRNYGLREFIELGNKNIKLIQKLSVLFFLLIVISVSGCTSNRISKVYVTNNKTINLLSPQAYTQEDIEISYIFQITYKNNSFMCLSVLSLSSLQLELYILNEMGLELGNLYYDGDILNYNYTFFPDNLKPEYIILDIQNIFYDFNYLFEHYKKQKIDFSQITDSNCITRTIKNNGIDIEKITITKNTIILNNYLRDYEYILTNMDE